MPAIAQLKTDRIQPDHVTPSLRSNFTWTFVGNVVYAACQWGVISVLAKLGDVAMVGRFALGLAITAPIFMFTNLQLRAVQATDASSEFEFADYFTLRVLGSLMGLATVCLVVVSGHYEWNTGAVIALVGVSKALESLGDVVAGLLQKVERLKRVSMSLMLRGGLSLPAFAGVFLVTRSLIAACATFVVVWLLVFAIYDVWQARIVLEKGAGFFALRWARLRQLALVSAPLGVVMTLISLNVNIPRYLLERDCGTSGLGLFASLAYLLVAMNLVVNALSQSAVTRLSLLFARLRLREFSRLLLKLSLSGVLLLLAGVPLALLLGRFLLALLYRPEYGNHALTLAIVVAAGSINSTAFFITSGLNAARCFRAQIPVFLLSTAVTLSACVVLIPRYHMNGAALSMLLAAIAGLLGNLFLIRSALKLASNGLSV